MAMTISLTDGTTTVQLNTSPIFAMRYVMATPEVNEATIANLGDGETLVTGPWGNVSESLELLITGADAAAVRDSVQSIERLLDKARQNRLTWRGVRVWLQIQFDHDSEVWRSEVLAGRLVHEHIGEDVWKAKIVSYLEITRRYYWEGALTQLQLTSAGTGSPTSDYVTVYNNDDANANTNWFQVAAAQVGGVLPSPLKLEVNNGSGSFKSVRALHLANYVHMDPTNVDPIIRGGQAVESQTTWAFAGEATVYRWALPTALLEDTNGQYCRVLITFSTLPDNSTLARARLQLSYDGIAFYDLVTGEQVKTGEQTVLDLGAMPIAPGGPGVGNADIYLTLNMYAATAAGDTAVVDWLQIVPAGHGLYRQLLGVVPNIGLADSESLIDDGVEGLIYTQLGSDTYTAYRNIHAPIHVWPGVTQRFRLIKQGQSTVGAGESYGVKAWYRPRRLTI